MEIPESQMNLHFNFFGVTWYHLCVVPCFFLFLYAMEAMLDYCRENSLFALILALCWIHAG